MTGDGDAFGAIIARLVNIYVVFGNVVIGYSSSSEMSAEDFLFSTREFFIDGSCLLIDVL